MSDRPGDRRPSIARAIPGADLLRAYDRAWLRPDIVAGATVFAILVPQSLAYGDLAGVAPVAGLYAAIGAMAVYAAFGRSRQLIVGPESGVAILVAAALAPLVADGDLARYATLAAALALMVGCLLIGAGLARVGFLADFLSKPVLDGYMIGVALVIIGSQLGKLFGLQLSADAFLGQVWEIAHRLSEAQPLTVAISAALIVLILGLKRLAPRVPASLVAVVVATAASALFDFAAHGVAIVGDIPSGLPVPTIPAVGLSDIAALAGPAISIAMLTFADGILTARLFASKNAYEIDANQELVGYGAANLGSGILTGFPVGASQSRTVVNDETGGKSQLVGIVASGLAVVFLLFFTPLLGPLPIAALGAVVIVAAIGLVDVSPLRALYRTRRAEFVLSVVTLFAVVTIGILQGIVIAVVLSIVYVISRIARPHSAVLGSVHGIDGFHEIARGRRGDPAGNQAAPGLIAYRFDAQLFFANCQYFHDEARSLVASADPHIEYFLVDTEAITDVDATGMAMLTKLHEELARQGIGLGVARAKLPLRETLARDGFLDLLGADNSFPTVTAGVAAFVARPRS